MKVRKLFFETDRVTFLQRCNSTDTIIKNFKMGDFDLK